MIIIIIVVIVFGQIAKIYASKLKYIKAPYS